MRIDSIDIRKPSLLVYEFVIMVISFIFHISAHGGDGLFISEHENYISNANGTYEVHENVEVRRGIWYITLCNNIGCTSMSKKPTYWSLMKATILKVFTITLIMHCICFLWFSQFLFREIAISSIEVINLNRIITMLYLFLYLNSNNEYMQNMSLKKFCKPKNYCIEFCDKKN